MGSAPIVEPITLDRYELLSQIGSGGMGAVYEGRHRITGRRVAVKVLHPRFATDRDIVDRFFNEARAAATLGHPNIVECFDAGVAQSGEAYLVLEYLEGRSLAAELEEVRALDPARAVRIALQVVSALAAAHARGVIHRDLKPDNVFLSQSPGQPDHVTVLDFGISRFHAGSAFRTRAGAVLGTPAYMAPEQLTDSSTIDNRADIYALGATLYQVLTGSLPFSADSLVGLAAKIAREAPRPPEQLRPGLPPALSRVVLRSMAKAPADRFSTMEALGAALASAAGIGTDEDEHTHRARSGEVLLDDPAGQSRTEEVALPDDAGPPPPPAPRPASKASMPSTRSPQRTGPPGGAARTGLLAAAGVVALVGGLLAVSAWSKRESTVAPAVSVVAPPPRVDAPVAVAPAPVADAPAVGVGERVLTVPSARPGLIPRLPLVVPRKPQTLQHAKPADHKAIDRFWADATRVPVSMRDLERDREPLAAVIYRLQVDKDGPTLFLMRAWLALTLAEARRTPAKPPVDFTGPGCDREMLKEGLVAIDKARTSIGESISNAILLEAASRSYTSYLDAVGYECQGDLRKAAEADAFALQMGEALDKPFRRSVFLHRARLALAQNDAVTARNMLDQCYEAAPSAERDLLEFWASALGWNCTGVVRVARELRLRDKAAEAATPSWLDRVELACLVDPAAQQGGRDPRAVDADWGAGDGPQRVDEARRLYADVGSPGAALRSALRLCYFRDRLASPPETLTLTVSGRLEQPALTGATHERLDALQACLAEELAATKLKGPIAVSTVELHVGP